MKKIATIPYSEVKFKWISSHWDIHLKGLCVHGGEVCLFETQGEGGYWNDEDEWIEPLVDIYELSIGELVEWNARQRKFEMMVGYHWSYPRKQDFHYRKPRWFFKFLFWLYYWKEWKKKFF